MTPPNFILGCATFGHSWTEPSDIKALATALRENGGVNTVDTAARYPPTSPGQSEILIGEAKLAESDFKIGTKVLFLGDGKGSLSTEAVEKSVATSLERLGTNQVSKKRSFCI